MANILVGADGNIAIPDDVREKYQLEPETALRLVETRNGILLVPLTDAPMSEELERELAEWQDLSLDTWQLFPYEDSGT
jgi:bifunctional DNA-binding transcriptional regulator/antitoxin component of YhaV-PrlF toxin-antitoxin module